MRDIGKLQVMILLKSERLSIKTISCLQMISYHGNLAGKQTDDASKQTSQEFLHRLLYLEKI